MLTDRYDSPLSTASTAARDAYVDGLDRMLAAQPGVEDAFDRAISADPGLAMAHLAKARFSQLQGDRDGVKASLADARAHGVGVSDREAAQIETMGLLLGGKIPDAYTAIRRHLIDHPRDVMLSHTCMGVFGLIGFSGQAGREAEQLAYTTSLAPAYGDDWWFLSQHAFAQMEAGQTGPAEASIERSLAGNPDNANGAHIKAHLHYETGETEAGYAYLDEWRRDYDKHGQLHCHISWHIALWALHDGDIDKMWQVIDADIAPGGAWGPAINVLTDLAAILYRAQLAGVEVPVSRWKAVSDYALASFPKPGIAFVDVHAALAHALAGNTGALEAIITGARGPAGDMVGVLAEAFRALVAGNHTEADAHLIAALADHARIGGSRAQRDLIEFAFAASLLRQGRADEARRLLQTRRPVSMRTQTIAGLAA